MSNLSSAEIRRRLKLLDIRVDNLEKMRTLYLREGNQKAADRASGRITEIIEDGLDLKALLSELEEHGR